MKRIARVLLGVALLTVFLMPAFSRAQTSNPPDIAALKAQLEALLKQVAELQRQIAAVQGEACQNFNVTLSFGSQGSEVAKLHSALRKIGSVIADDEVQKQSFGESTAAAVVGFQLNYRSEILQPLGLQNPTGVFGPATRKVFNRLYGCGGEYYTTPIISPVSEQEKVQKTQVVKLPETDEELKKFSKLEKGTVRVSVFSIDENYKKPIPITYSAFTVSLYHAAKVYDPCAARVSGSEECFGKEISAEGSLLAVQTTVNGIAEFRDVPAGFYVGRVEAPDYETARFGFSATFTEQDPVTETGVGINKAR